MRKFYAIALLTLLLIGGCEESQQKANNNDVLPNQPHEHGSGFIAERIRVTGLTEFVDENELLVYLDLLDQFGDRTKMPAKFRFELYQYAPRSAEPKGKRLLLWPVVDLTNAETNNEHWRDFLRSYEFRLDVDVEIVSGQAYVLEAVCLTQQGRRPTATKRLVLKSK